ncbi:hypothetical protein G3N95_21745 [Paraburkholderia sp. Tr-20389]|uniref:hypothetical protein n=1 Tax=Paraburkholderia sp. Tr-20389 TaxID=2703903 RepID=UPI001980ABE0|nr:hypothetical protein [Paraburkholderia sp. Tr-20389]MBN3755581.1 hypothetical protein [Paraburkholderia sp. Tr-20389]
MIRFDLIVLSVAASLVVSLTPARQAIAQPSAMKPMQDAQRKAEQKARNAQKKDEEQAASQDKAPKPDSTKPASSP